MRKTVALILLMSVAMSCSYRKSKQKDEYKSPFEESHGKEWWEVLIPEEDVEFYSKSPKDQLRYAKHAAAESKYKTAIETYLKLYQRESIESGIREEALFNLGRIYSSFLYPYKDYEKSMYFFEKLISEFPDSRFRSKTVKAIENLNQLKKISN